MPVPVFRVLASSLILFAWLAQFSWAEQAGKEKKDKVEWTRVESTPISRPDNGKSRSGMRIQVGIVTRSTEGVVLRRTSADGREKVIRKLEAGNRIFVGDQFEVGKASAVEMTFGHNARLRVGENSIMRIVNKVVETRGAVVNTQRDLELKKGSARVRVKKSVRKPSPIIVIAGSMVLTVERSDTVVKRTEDKSEVMVLNGTADLILKDEGSRSWSGGSMIRVRRAEKILVPDKIGNKLPAKEKMKQAEIKMARGRLSFSIEDERRQLPPAPAHDKELDKP